MATDIVISAERLGKKYIIGHQTQRGRYVALRDVMTRATREIWRATADMLRGRAVVAGDTTEEVWALRDVNFEVQRGEVVGIIGHNGAGKSTLLKILSRITEPTEGRVRIEGRIASLLEVGTGFHPELTGRENIYLNGAILGMSRAEIKRKLDEIVDFAELEKFLDTPVKRYSSGMYVRLAFAIAAHLDPEILIVDEVLAVGDASFQEKCIGKIKDVSRARGRTVLLVSHNMGATQSLCGRAIVLDRGNKVFAGPTRDAIQFYLQKNRPQGNVQDTGKWFRTGTGEARVLSILFQDEEGQQQSRFSMGEPIIIAITANFAAEIRDPTFGVNISTDTGVMVADCRSSHYNWKPGVMKGTVECLVRIDSLALYPRSYIVEPWIMDSACLSLFDWVRNAAAFLVSSGPRCPNVNADHGIAFISTSWSLGH
jgi:lipopolysaccharide transport system ATP-binding protein